MIMEHYTKMLEKLAIDCEIYETTNISYDDECKMRRNLVKVSGLSRISTLSHLDGRLGASTNTFKELAQNGRKVRKNKDIERFKCPITISLSVLG